MNDVDGMGLRCAACGGREAVGLYEGISRCRTCTHVFVDRSVPDEELVRLYQVSYFKGEEYLDYLADRRVLEKNFRARVRVLEKHWGNTSAQSLLEVGCAYGFFLNLIAPRFARAVGIDISEDAVNYARQVLGVDARNIAISDPQLELGGRYDVACMWDTIEHLAAPDACIERLSKLVRPNGLLAVTTGDISSLLARLRGRRWRLIHPPTHLHYFTRHSLRTLLARFGFQVIHDEACGFFRSVGNILHNVLALRWRQQRIYDLLAKTPLVNAHLYLNTYDIRFVIARRIPRTEPGK